MPFSDLALSKRLESAEACAAAHFAEARRRVFPDSATECMENAGVTAIFDGVASPVTQSFGLGLYAAPTPDSFATIERFFWDRGAPAIHEVSPFAGLATLNLLCERQYRPIEVSSVLYRSVEMPEDQNHNNVRVRRIVPGEEQLWSDISAEGWAQEHPEVLASIKQFGAVIAASSANVCFLAESSGEPAAAGVLCMHDGVALFGGSSTRPNFRRRGLQSALLTERMRYAFESGCELAMMVAEAGSNSQRNAERKGFRVAYTRIKWKLASR